MDVNGALVTVQQQGGNDDISLTDIADVKEGAGRAADIIKNWIRNRGTLEFIGSWEQLNNPDYNVVELDHFIMRVGLPSFVLSPGLWVAKTAAIGIVDRAEY